MKKKRQRTIKPYKIARLKTPITLVEVAKENTAGQILVFAGNLSGWIEQDEVMDAV